MGMERLIVQRFQLNILSGVKLSTCNHGLLSVNSIRNGTSPRTFSKTPWQEKRGVLNRKTLTVDGVANTSTNNMGEQSRDNIESETYSKFAVYEKDQANVSRRSNNFNEYNHIQSEGIDVQSMRSNMRKKYRLSGEYPPGPDERGIDRLRPMQVPSETSHVQDIDFYGIEHETDSNTQIMNGEEILTMKNAYPVRLETEGEAPEKQEHFDRLIELPFGTVRFDHHNVPVKRKSSSGQRNNVNVNSKEHQQKEITRLFEPNQDNMLQKKYMKESERKTQQTRLSDIKTGTLKNSGVSYIEEQYFQSSRGFPKQKEDIHPTASGSLDEPKNFVEEQYFGETAISDQDNGQFERIASQYNNQMETNINEDSHPPFSSYTKKEVPSKKQISTNTDETNFIEDQFFSALRDGDVQSKKQILTDTDETNFIEDQFFSAMRDGDVQSKKQISTDTDETNFMEDQFFSALRDGDVQSKKQISTDTDETNFIEDQFFSALRDGDSDKIPVHLQMPDPMKIKDSTSEKMEKDENKATPKQISKPEDTKNFQKKTLVEENTIIAADVITKHEKRLREKIRPNLETPSTAYDVAMKIRKELKTSKLEPKIKENILTKPPRFVNWSGEVDSKGYRILKGQVLNLSDFTEDAVVNILKNSILYQDDDIVAIDKPYGLPSHGGPGLHHSIGKLLPKLAECLHVPKNTLHLIHRLDKETTGVMVLGKKEDIAWKLHGMFKRREVVKKYWVLTKGIPNPTKGMIDIPMIEDEVGDRYRMGLRPHYDSDTKIIYKKAKKVEKFEAITNFEVLDSNNSAALIECQPETGVKHQIRCHLAFGLNTPILGDHKYSHFTVMKPQKLYPVILEKLGIRQAKVRHLPMHLHAKSLVLPEYKDNKNIFISARLPSYFVQNMTWLKIKPPK